MLRDLAGLPRHGPNAGGWRSFGPRPIGYNVAEESRAVLKTEETRIRPSSNRSPPRPFMCVALRPRRTLITPSSLGLMNRDENRGTLPRRRRSLQGSPRERDEPSQSTEEGP
jgi:hypothetical protein